MDSFAGTDSLRAGALWKLYLSEPDNAKKTELLFRIGDEYFLEHELSQRDSVFQIALTLELVQMNGNNAQLMSIYNWYFSKEYAFDNKNALDYAGRMDVIGRNDNNDEWLYDAYFTFYKIESHLGKPSVALSYITKANYYANTLNDETMKAKSLLELGNCQDNNNNKIEAFRNYRDALLIANKLNNDTLLYESYERLSEFFRLIKNFEKAKEYKQKQYSMLIKQQPIDSSKLMILYNGLSNILFKNNERLQGEKIWRIELNYAFQHHDKDMLNKAFTIYRGYLIENRMLKDLSDLYTKQYPNELVEISDDNPSLYCRLKAYIAEADGNYDSSAYYYRMAEDHIIKESKDNVFIANFYKRYGQFLLRKGDLPMAKVKFEQAYDYARQARYYPYIIDATQYLDSISYQEHDLPAAYAYEKQNRAYTDSQATAAKEDELLLLEIDNENRQHEIAIAKEKANTERRHNLQDIGIMIFISVLFIVLVMLGSFKMPKFLIKSMGFVSFILLFEFIVMITDTKVENYTHGEPWKILLFKLIIIGTLAPIHHSMEHKLLNYLYEHKILDPAKMSLRPIIARLRNRIKAEETEHKENDHEH
jgi:hypothetical protein